MNMHISNAINHFFMSLLPLLVCFTCPRLWSFSTSLLPSLSMSSMSKFSPSFISLSNFSPFVINHHKGHASTYWYKGWYLGRWLRLESSFWWTPPYVGMTPLVDGDTTRRIPHVSRTLWPWYQRCVYLPLSHCIGHPLDNLEILLVMEASLDLIT